MSATERPAASSSRPPGGRSALPSTSVPSAIPAHLPERLPAAVGKYQVLERLGAGAMGVVYKCSQPGLDRPVAVKVLLAAGHAGGDHVARFEREARAAARLSHPNVVQVYDVGCEGGLNYFVMEYVEGCSLDRLIGTPALTVERSLRLVVHVAQALEAAHRLGIVHRDVKPSNILLDAAGRPKLADFGLAKALDSPALSGSGDLIGTPRYMSPEQALEPPEALDARTDVYSLGAVLYEMLTRRPPFDGPSALAILRQLADEEPVPVRQLNPAVPEEVAEVCARAMAKDRAQRYPSAGAFAQAVQTYLLEKLFGGREPTPFALPPPAPAHPRWRRRAALALAAFGLVAVAVLAGALARSGRPAETNGEDRQPAEVRSPDRAKLLAQAREQLRDGASQPDGGPGRERVRVIIEDLSALLRQTPADAEARFLRARAYRRVGECLAALDDLAAVSRLEPNNLAAVHERLLAGYELYVLYLGNLSEPALRPSGLGAIQDDVRTLAERGDDGQKYLAALVEAVARWDYGRAAGLAAAGPRGMRPGELPDVKMVQADALFHAADQAYLAELATEATAEKEAKKAERERWVEAAGQALRRGLDANPNHVGLLFLKAAAQQRRAVWDAGGDDPDAALKRQRPLFETALDRLRLATLRAGPDTPLARAVLLSNAGRDDPARDQLKDALSCRPTVRYLVTLDAWLQLRAPPDGPLTPEGVEHILRDLQPAFEAPPPDFNTYFVRALLQAAAGRWPEARADLLQCRRRLGLGPLPTATPTYAAWLDLAGGPATRFLDTTINVLWWHLSTPVDLRIRLSEEMLRRLADQATAVAEGLAPEEVKTLTGAEHVRLAKFCTEKDDRPCTLAHLKTALEMRLPDLTPASFRTDETLKVWNDNDEFKALYKQYEPAME